MAHDNPDPTEPAHNSTDTAPPAAETTPAPASAPVAPAPAAAPAVPQGPRNYLVMMLLAVLLTPTGLARAYRGEEIGWKRFWVFVGVYGATILLAWVPFLNILLLLGLLGLFIWGAVDVFQLYKTRTDADGDPLTTTPRDERFGRAFYIFFIVMLVTTGVGLLMLLAFSAVLVSLFMNAANNPNSGSRNDFNNSEFLRDLESYNR